MSDLSNNKSHKSRVVLKIGTISLTSEDRLAVGTMAKVVEVCSTLRKRGYEVIVVTSGAIDVGCKTVGIKTKPTDMARQQATAAIGQLRIMRMWGDLFASAKMLCGQALLTFDNLGELMQRKSATDTFDSLFDFGVVPIVNENDTVATFESRQRFGENDRLSAVVAALVEADWLFLLTDVDGIFTTDPKTNPDAQKINVVKDIDDLPQMADTGTDGPSYTFSSGGMATQVAAARAASDAGCRTVILHAEQPQGILEFCTEKAAGLRQHPDAVDDGIRCGVGTLILPKAHVYTPTENITCE